MKKQIPFDRARQRPLTGNETVISKRDDRSGTGLPSPLPGADPEAGDEGGRVSRLPALDEEEGEDN